MAQGDGRVTRLFHRSRDNIERYHIPRRGVFAEVSLRTEARHNIVAAANRQINAAGRTPPLTMRRLNLAVSVVRHHGLVDAATLDAAGFNATARNPLPNRTLRATARQRREAGRG